MKRAAEYLIEEIGECKVSWHTALKAVERAQKEAIVKAAEVAQEPYLKAGMTNLANRAKQGILSLLNN